MAVARVTAEITFNAKSVTLHLTKVDARGLTVQTVASKKNRPSRWEEAALLSRLRTAIDGVLANDQGELF